MHQVHPMIFFVRVVSRSAQTATCAGGLRPYGLTPPVLHTTPCPPSDTGTIYYVVFNPYLQQVLLSLNTILQYLCSFLYFIQPL